MNEETDRLQALLRVHDLATANFRQELMERTPSEVAYDDYLLLQLKKGKKFKIAVRKANQKFPTEALNSGDEDTADLEAHYRYLLDMEEIDSCRAELDKTSKEIKEIDSQIAALVESMMNKNPEGPAPPPSS
jgi:hypothetical protein